MKSFIKGIGIQNFKSFQDDEWFDIAPITVFTGKNGAGKSSIIQALKIFSDYIDKYTLKGFDDDDPKYKDEIWVPFSLDINTERYFNNKTANDFFSFSFLTEHIIEDLEYYKKDIIVRFFFKLTGEKKTELSEITFVEKETEETLFHSNRLTEEFTITNEGHEYLFNSFRSYLTADDLQTKSNIQLDPIEKMKHLSKAKRSDTKKNNDKEIYKNIIYEDLKNNWLGNWQPFPLKDYFYGNSHPDIDKAYEELRKNNWILFPSNLFVRVEQGENDLVVNDSKIDQLLRQSFEYFFDSVSKSFGEFKKICFLTPEDLSIEREMSKDSPIVEAIKEFEGSSTASKKI